MIEDIESPNFQALFNFKKSIKREDATKHKVATFTQVQVTYHWKNNTQIVETEARIILNHYPYSVLKLTPQDWLDADEFYLDFQTGYGDFIFDSSSDTLIIAHRENTKIGPYQVEIREI